MPLEAKDDWHGPLKVTYLKAELRNLAKELETITEGEALNQCLDVYHDILNQARYDLPDWHEAARAGITAKQNELTDSMEKTYGISSNQ